MHSIKELKYGNTRCFCINDKLIIDTDRAGTMSAFYRCAKESGVKLDAVEYLMITHFHPDHMGIARELSDIGIKIVVFDVQKEYIHFSDRIYGREKRSNFKPIDDDSVLCITCAQSREFLSRLGIDAQVIHTVGHSEDSVSLVTDDGVAIVGDLYPIRTVPAYNDSRLEDSWNSILSCGVNRICYGHAPSEFIANIKSIEDLR